ncbi:MAG: tRNA guanosine(34) transglycosylase Tgt [Actinobacteria bacterium]|nr:tRNA guanosine(34) transglycosylase Tgt [Actinomycetota bacterium]
MEDSLRFEILGRDPNTMARVGRLITPRGEVVTPAFLPVGTRGAVKSMAPWEVAGIGFQMILANTYHLYLRPGVEVVREAGGLHAFMGWEGPILTDSGGFQVFSLSPTLKVEDDGVRFRSVYDGSEHFLTPELAVRVQEELGSDIAMVLDHCVAYPASREEVERSVETTLRWAERSLRAHTVGGQALFGIVQGGAYPDLRARSAELTSSLDFPGYGIGGLSVGEPREVMLRCLEVQSAILPEDRPRHLLGIGDPEGLLEAVSLGMDLFDCVLPTRMARTGVAFTRQGKLNLRHARHARDHRPLEEGCPCPACTCFSRAYLRHLHRVNEMLAHRMLTWHNLAFMHRLLLDCRRAIGAGRMLELIREWEGWSGRQPS